MISKEKVRELANRVSHDLLIRDKNIGKITEWLEQNQPEQIVGLSDEQLNQLFNYFPFKATKDEFIEGYQEWAKTQSFTQPEVKEIVVGLSNEQISEIVEILYSKTDVSNPHEPEFYIKEWLKTQTFEQPCESLIADNLTLTLAKELEQMTKDRDRLFELHCEQLKLQPFTPNWDDAPSWAEWLAQDENSSWTWYETRPKVAMGYFSTQDICENIVVRNENWNETLQQRQKPAPSVELEKPVTEQNQEVKVEKFEIDWSKHDDDVVSVQHGYITYDTDSCTQWFEVGNMIYRPKPTPQVEVGQVWEGEGIKVKVGCLGRVSKNGEESIAFVDVDTNELKTWLLKTFLAKFELTGEQK